MTKTPFALIYFDHVNPEKEENNRAVISTNNIVAVEFGVK